MDQYPQGFNPQALLQQGGIQASPTPAAFNPQALLSQNYGPQPGAFQTNMQTFGNLLQQQGGQPSGLGQQLQQTLQPAFNMSQAPGALQLPAPPTMPSTGNGVMSSVPQYSYTPPGPNSGSPNVIAGRPVDTSQSVLTGQNLQGNINNLQNNIAQTQQQQAQAQMSQNLYNINNGQQANLGGYTPEQYFQNFANQPGNTQDAMQQNYGNQPGNNINPYASQLSDLNQQLASYNTQLGSAQQAYQTWQGNLRFAGQPVTAANPNMIAGQTYSGQPTNVIAGKPT